ncbi:MAG TPA: phytanoyl-CoA dioxygenase family protein [Candidatus Binatia bacterium]
MQSAIELFRAQGYVVLPSAAGRLKHAALPILREVLADSTVRPLIDAVCGPTPVVFRAVLLEKTQACNWALPWHQDLRLPVRHAPSPSGFWAATVESGVPNVQPPIELLARMLTLRVHLDPCDGTNGALHIAPGSHRLGRVASGHIASLPELSQPTVCEAGVGDVLVMDRLLLHSSPLSRSSRRRRVIHLELAGVALPEPLAWHEFRPLWN